MGAFIPGMDEHNAVNNSDGFSTGFLGNKPNNSFNPVPPQGYMDTNQQGFSSTPQMPMGNFQDMSSAGSQMQAPKGVDQIQIVENEQKKKLSMPSLPINNLNNTNQMNPVNQMPNFNNQNISQMPNMNNTAQMPNMGNTAQMPNISNTSQMPSINNTAQMPINIVADNQGNDNKPNSLTPPPFSKSEGFKRTLETPPEKPKPSVNERINEIINKKEKNSKVEGSEKSKSNKIVHIVALSVIGVLILFIVLISTGVLKHGKKDEVAKPDTTYVDKDKERIEEILTKLNGGCNNLSASGSYGEEKISADSECKNLVCFIDNNVICQNSICMIAVDEKVYTRVCSTGESRVANKAEFQAKLNLDILCEILNNSPELNGNLKDDYGTCNNYECVTTIDGKSYDSTCQKNG